MDPTHAIPKEKGEYTNKYGVKTKKCTTKGWELCVEWRDGSTDWVSLKDIKNSYPVEAAMYACDNNIHEEPAFAWWVPYTLISSSGTYADDIGVFISLLGNLAFLFSFFMLSLRLVTIAFM